MNEPVVHPSSALLQVITRIQHGLADVSIHPDDLFDSYWNDVFKPYDLLQCSGPVEEPVVETAARAAITLVDTELERGSIPCFCVRGTSFHHGAVFVDDEDKARGIWFYDADNALGLMHVFSARPSSWRYTVVPLAQERN